MLQSSKCHTRLLICNEKIQHQYYEERFVYLLIALHITDIMSFTLRKRDYEIPFNSHTRALPAPDRTETTSARYGQGRKSSFTDQIYHIAQSWLARISHIRSSRSWTHSQSFVRRWPLNISITTLYIWPTCHPFIVSFTSNFIRLFDGNLHIKVVVISQLCAYFTNLTSIHIS